MPFFIVLKVNKKKQEYFMIRLGFFSFNIHMIIIVQDNTGKEENYQTKLIKRKQKKTVYY